MRTEAETSGNLYVERVNRAMDHVLGHLGEPLCLKEIARIAGFSPYHFHRVFKSLVGETPGEFVKRQRLERALRNKAHSPGRSLTEIALDCGFSSPSDFSRCFKARYGVPPSAFDLNAWSAARRRELQAASGDESSRHQLQRLPAGENPDGFSVTLCTIPPRTVAYIRVQEPYAGGVSEAAERLVSWARARGAQGGQWLGYMWEHPELVALDDCRYDVAVEVAHVEPEGEIGRYDFPEMRVAEVQIVGSIELELRALDWLYTTWLPRSGYEPDDLPCFEAWHGLPFAHGMEHFTLAAQLPVRAAPRR